MKPPEIRRNVAGLLPGQCRGAAQYLPDGGCIRLARHHVGLRLGRRFLDGFHQPALLQQFRNLRPAAVRCHLLPGNLRFHQPAALRPLGGLGAQRRPLHDHAAKALNSSDPGLESFVVIAGHTSPTLRGSFPTDCLQIVVPPDRPA